MIDEIHVRNLALIQDATLLPDAGMTAITGETGAGKTALLASCRLLMGQRAEKDLVREGESEANIQGRLFLPESTDRDAHVDIRDRDADRTSGGEVSEREVVIDRRLTADGRSRVRINGQMASVSELASEVSPYIDLCSQHSQRILSVPSAQRHYLDLWAGVVPDGTLDAYMQAYREAKDASSRLEELRANVLAGDAALDEARYKLRQIDALSPSREDYDELMSTLRKAENAEALVRTTGEASAALSGEGGVLDGMNAAIALLTEGSRADESLVQHADSLRESLYVIEDVAHDVAKYTDAIELDVSTLEFMQERASAYQSLLRRYGPEISDLLATAEEAQATVDAVENSDELMREAEAALNAAEERLVAAADALTAAREAAAPSLEDAVNGTLARLEMGGAEMLCRLERLDRGSWGEAGADDVRFLFRPAAGMQGRPLSKIASGGELSRVMLALHVAMGDRDNVPTLVFDEIDAGVGGATALALADVLSELAESHQVIVVTHLAQVAAKAQRHYVASKLEVEGVAQTLISEVGSSRRVEELARMLSGSITASSLAHAAELLDM